MVDKLTFSVDSIDIEDSKPSDKFAKVSLDFFASGMNAHDLYVSEEVLDATAKTIYNVPIVWKYERYFDDAGTHDSEEVPCGFVQEGQEIEKVKLEDGRTMLRAVGYLWKRYSGRLMEILKRDDGEKPVSVEMSVYEMGEKDGKETLLDYVYEAVTILGSSITPAIPMAGMSVMSFAKEETKDYIEDYLEFSTSRYAELDMSVPDGMKKSAKHGLEMVDEVGGATAVSISMAKKIVSSEKLPPEKVRQISRYFKRMAKKNLSGVDNAGAAWELYGGNTGLEWSSKLSGQMDELDEKVITYFQEEFMPYQKRSEMPPSLKGIDPPITASQGSQIARQAEAMVKDGKEESSAWAIAISNFKKTHKKEEGKWVRKEKMEERNLPLTDEDSTPDNGKEESTTMEDMEKDEVMEKEMETPKEKEMAEVEIEVEEDDDEEEKDGEEDEEEPVSMSDEKMFAMTHRNLLERLQAALDSHQKSEEDWARYYAVDHDDNYVYVECWKEGRHMYRMSYTQSEDMGVNVEISKEEEVIFSPELVGEATARKQEMQELREFKSNIETQQFEIRVNKELLSMSKTFPTEKIDEAREDSKNFSIHSFSEWANKWKAMAFDFAVHNDDNTYDENDADGLVVIPVPREEKTEKKKVNSIW